MNVEFKTVGFMFGEETTIKLEAYFKEGWAVFCMTSMYTNDEKRYLGGSAARAQFYITLIRGK